MAETLPTFRALQALSAVWMRCCILRLALFWKPFPHSCVHVPVVLQTVTSEVLPGLRTLIGSLPPVDVQVLLQYQLILSAFIQSALIPYSAENRREMQAIPYENAADLENTLNAVRQRLDAQPTIV